MMRDAQVVYGVPRSGRGWELEEETMPESAPHHLTVNLLEAILSWWARGRDGVQVASNLAVRWDPRNPRIGVDPDVCVLSPAPPEGLEISSIRTWQPGHAPPLLAVEVVSNSDPRKDYAIAPDKYAASGTRELWVFDPLLAGPTTQGGPFRLQVWRRDDEGRFVRAYAGDGPAYSELLSAHLVVTDEGKRLRLADDAEGAKLWPTPEEAACARERDACAREREALARVAQLEAELAKR